MTEKKEFKKIWEGEFDVPNEWLKKVVKITTVDQSDFVWQEEWPYWTEIVYKFDMTTPDGIEQAELRINENKKALWKIKIWKKEYVIWRIVNDDGVVNLFKYEDKYWARVEKKKNKKDETYYKIKFSYKYDPEDVMVDDTEEDEMF